MQGLRTHETSKFIEFFKLVQAEADCQGFVFFLDAGDGHDVETDTLEGEDLQGWLIPKNKANEFQKQYERGITDEKWDNFYAFAVWELKNGKIIIKFK